MQPLAPQHLRRARAIAADLNRGDELTPSELDALCAEWFERIQPSPKDVAERFSLVHPDGAASGVSGPRWIFHLLGLRHRAAEIAFSTEAGLILLQRRSEDKDNWPGALDMTVAGHISDDEAGQNCFEAGAWREIEEEIALSRSGAADTLVEGALIPVGTPYFCFESYPDRNPPFLDAEVRQVFAATITGAGLAQIRFADGEVAGMLLVTPDRAWRILLQPDIASGLRYSLPRYLDWLERQGGSRV